MTDDEWISVFAFIFVHGMMISFFLRPKFFFKLISGWFLFQFVKPPKSEENN